MISVCSSCARFVFVLAFVLVLVLVLAVRYSCVIIVCLLCLWYYSSCGIVGIGLVVLLGFVCFACVSHVILL